MGQGGAARPSPFGGGGRDPPVRPAAPRSSTAPCRRTSWRACSATPIPSPTSSTRCSGAPAAAPARARLARRGGAAARRGRRGRDRHHPGGGLHRHQAHHRAERSGTGPAGWRSASPPGVADGARVRAAGQGGAGQLGGGCGRPLRARPRAPPPPLHPRRRRSPRAGGGAARRRPARRRGPGAHPARHHRAAPDPADDAERRAAAAPRARHAPAARRGATATSSPRWGAAADTLSPAATGSRRSCVPSASVGLPPRADPAAGSAFPVPRYHVNYR